jgi:pseudouridine kinase
MGYVLVIGALNIDITGRPSGRLIKGESNIGRVSIGMGGVGHNIALNLALCGAETKLICALGEDVYAQAAIKEADSFGLDISHSLIANDMTSSVYLCLCNEKGDMETAINDMSVINSLSPNFLNEKKDIIQNASLIVIDCNLPQDSIDYILSTAKTQVFADTVSAVKAEKLSGRLDKLHTIKPNRAEAEVLSGVRITDINTAAKAARALIEKGLERVFITLGSEGVYCAEKKSSSELYMPVEGFKPVNATGAGDAFMAAVAYAYLKGFDLKKTASVGMSAARQAALTAETVNYKINIEEG